MTVTIQPTTSHDIEWPGCPNCGAEQHGATAFCMQCGCPLPTTPAIAEQYWQLAADHVTAEMPPEPIAEDARRPRWQRVVLVSAGAVVLGITAGVAGAALLAPSAPEQALTTGAAQTTELLHKVSTAKSTADLRAVAAQTGPVQTAVQQGIAQAADDQELGANLTAVDRVLTGVAGLKAIDRDHLGAWKATATSLASAAPHLTEGSDELLQLGAEARVAAAQTGATVAEFRQQMADWRQAHRAALRERQEHRAAVQHLATYESGVESLLSQYSDLRDETDRFTALIESPGAYVTWASAYDEMYTGAEARRDIRDSLSALRPGMSLNPAHDRLVAMLESAADAMHDAHAGLTDAETGSDGSYYADTDNWQHFQAESDRITDEFASAESQWQQAIARTYRQNGAVKMPAKPVL